MFRNLFDFGFKRSLKEAFGFYLSYFLLIALSGGFLGGIAGLILNTESMELGLRIGTIVAMTITVIIGMIILKEKKLHSNFFLVLLVIFAGLFAFFAGALGGLIPISYLTTKDDKNKE